MTAPRTRTKKRGLTFTPGNHTYRLDGEWVPSVTGVLRTLDKPGLISWAAGLVAEWVADNPDTPTTLGREPFIAAAKKLPDEARNKAANRGTTLHDYAAALLEGHDVDVPDPLVPVVEHALDFLDDWHIQPLVIERPVGHRQHRYAGTVDLIASYRRPDTGVEGVGVFDWKSGKRIYTEAAWQLAAYAGAEFYVDTDGAEHPLPVVDGSFGVHIRADGYDVHPLALTGLHDEFLQILSVYHAARRGKGDWQRPGTGYVGAAIQEEAS